MFRQRTTIKSDTLRDAAYGAVGGVVGTLLMSPVTTALYRRESPEKKQREEKLRAEPPFETLAGRLIALVGVEPTQARKENVGTVVHWAYGMAWGALYGVCRNRFRAFSRFFGVPFGVAFFVVGDELMNVVMGLTPPPKAYPLDAHLRGLAGHVTYAAGAEATYRVLDAALR